MNFVASRDVLIFFLQENKNWIHALKMYWITDYNYDQVLNST